MLRGTWGKAKLVGFGADKRGSGEYIGRKSHYYNQKKYYASDQGNKQKQKLL